MENRLTKVRARRKKIFRLTIDFKTRQALGEFFTDIMEILPEGASYRREDGLDTKGKRVEAYIVRRKGE